jgi:hypothetical protein
LQAEANTMPFAYYSRLSKRDQAIYRQSASVTEIVLDQTDAAKQKTRLLQVALADGDRLRIQASAQALSDVILTQLGVCKLVVRVLAVRPSSARSELHGLYERTQRQPAVVRVWMRTAVHKRVVSFRTFLRTLVHELCHHLDYELYKLPDSFHTEGFFKRESSLVRQLLVTGRAVQKSAEDLYAFPDQPLAPLLAKVTK